MKNTNRLIFDNSGNVMLQTKEFFHVYKSNEISQLISDIYAFMQDNDTSYWADNEPQFIPEEKELNSHNYNVFEFTSIDDLPLVKIFNTGGYTQQSFVELVESHKNFVKLLEFSL